MHLIRQSVCQEQTPYHLNNSLDTHPAFSHTLPSKIQNYGRVAIYAYIRYKFSRFFRYQDRPRSFSN